MLEKILSSIIAGHLSKFLRNVPEERLRLSLWAGEVTLDNLELQEDVFDQLSLLIWKGSTQGNWAAAASPALASLLMPFTVVKGVVRSLSISLPWSTLDTEPISVEISGVDVVLGPVRQRAFSAAEEQARDQAVKDIQIAAFEGRKASGTSKGSRNGGSSDTHRRSSVSFSGLHPITPDSQSGVVNLPASPPSGAASPGSGAGADKGFSGLFLDRLIQTIIRNIHVTIKDVSVRFAFDYPGLHPSMAASTMLHIEEIVVVTTDEAWQPRFVSSTAVPHGRVVHIGAISARTSCGSAASTLLLAPFDVTARVLTPADSAPEQRLSISLSTTPIEFHVHPVAVKAVMACTDSVTKALLYAPFRKHLPLMAAVIAASTASEGGAGSEMSAPTALQRWRFALACVREKVRERLGCWGPRTRRFLSLKRAYIALDKRSRGVAWLPSLSDEERKRKAQMEEALEFHQIVFLRCLALAELEEERRHVADERAGIARASLFASSRAGGVPAAPPRRRWLGGLGGWWGRAAAVAPPPLAENSLLTDEQRGEEVESGRLYGEAQIRARVVLALKEHLAAVDLRAGVLGDGAKSLSNGGAPAGTTALRITADIPKIGLSVSMGEAGAPSTLGVVSLSLTDVALVHMEPQALSSQSSQLEVGDLSIVWRSSESNHTHSFLHRAEDADTSHSSHASSALLTIGVAGVSGAISGQLSVLEVAVPAPDKVHHVLALFSAIHEAALLSSSLSTVDTLTVQHHPVVVRPHHRRSHSRNWSSGPTSPTSPTTASSAPFGTPTSSGPRAHIVLNGFRLRVCGPVSDRHPLATLSIAALDVHVHAAGEVHISQAISPPTSPRLQRQSSIPSHAEPPSTLVSLTVFANQDDENDASTTTEPVPAVFVRWSGFAFSQNSEQRRSIHIGDIFVGLQAREASRAVTNIQAYLDCHQSLMDKTQPPDTDTAATTSLAGAKEAPNTPLQRQRTAEGVDRPFSSDSEAPAAPMSDAPSMQITVQSVQFAFQLTSSVAPDARLPTTKSGVIRVAAPASVATSPPSAGMRPSSSSSPPCMSLAVTKNGAIRLMVADVRSGVTQSGDKGQVQQWNPAGSHRLLSSVSIEKKSATTQDAFSDKIAHTFTTVIRLEAPHIAIREELVLLAECLMLVTTGMNSTSARVVEATPPAPPVAAGSGGGGDSRSRPSSPSSSTVSTTRVEFPSGAQISVSEDCTVRIAPGAQLTSTQDSVQGTALQLSLNVQSILIGSAQNLLEDHPLDLSLAFNQPNTNTPQAEAEGGSVNDEDPPTNTLRIKTSVIAVSIGAQEAGAMSRLLQSRMIRRLSLCGNISGLDTSRNVLVYKKHKGQAENIKPDATSPSAALLLDALIPDIQLTLRGKRQQDEIRLSARNICISSQPPNRNNDFVTTTAARCDMVLLQDVTLLEDVAVDHFTPFQQRDTNVATIKSAQRGVSTQVQLTPTSQFCISHALRLALDAVSSDISASMAINVTSSSTEQTTDDLQVLDDEDSEDISNASTTAPGVSSDILVVVTRPLRLSVFGRGEDEYLITVNAVTISSETRFVVATAEDGHTVVVPTSSAQVKTTVDLSGIRFEDRSCRRLLISSLPNDDPQQPHRQEHRGGGCDDMDDETDVPAEDNAANAAQGSSPVRVLPAGWPIATCRGVQIQMTSGTSPTSTHQKTAISVDSPHVNLLFESLLGLRDALMPDSTDAVAPTATTGTASITTATATASSSSPTVSAPPPPSTPTPPVSSSSEFSLTLSHMTATLHESWAEPVCRYEVGQFEVSSSTSSASSAAAPPPLKVSLRDVTMRDVAVCGEEAAGAVFIGPVASVSILVSAKERPSSAAPWEPAPTTAISLDVSPVHVAVCPALLRVSSTAVVQLVPLSALAEGPVMRRWRQTQRVTDTNAIRMTIARVVVALPACEETSTNASSASSYPWTLSMAAFTITNTLSPTTTADQQVTYWRDHYDVSCEEVAMDPPYLLIRSTATAAHAEDEPTSTRSSASRPYALRIVAAKPLVYTAMHTTARTSILFPQAVDPTITPDAPVFDLAIQVFAGPVHLDVVPPLVTGALHMGQRLSAVPVFAAHAARSDPRVQKTAAVALRKLSSALYDEGGVERVLGWSVEEALVEFNMSTGTTGITCRGPIAVRDGRGLPILTGADSATVGVSIAADGGTTVRASGLELAVDRRRVAHLSKVVVAVDALTVAAARVARSPTAAVAAAAPQQTTPPTPPFIIAIETSRVVIGGIASLNARLVSVTLSEPETRVTVSSVELLDLTADGAVRATLGALQISSKASTTTIDVTAPGIRNHSAFFIDCARVGLEIQDAAKALAATAAAEAAMATDDTQSSTPAAKADPQVLTVRATKVLISLSSNADAESSDMAAAALEEQAGRLEMHFPLIRFTSKALRNDDASSATSSFTTTSLVEASDGLILHRHVTSHDSRPLCRGLDLKVALMDAPERSSTTVEVGKVFFSAPLGLPLQHVVSIAVESLTPYGIVAQALSTGESVAYSSETDHRPSALPQKSELSVAAPRLAWQFYECSTIDAATHNVVVSAEVLGTAFRSTQSATSSVVELTVRAVQSRCDASLQEEFIRLEATRGSANAATVQLETTTDASQRSQARVVWGTASLSVSPALLSLLDSNVLRPALVGVRNAMRECQARVVDTTSFTSSVVDSGSGGGFRIISRDFTFSEDTLLGGMGGTRLHICRREDSPNVIHISGDDVTIRIAPADPRPVIVVDSGLSVYCHGITFRVPAAEPSLAAFVHAGDGAFFHVPANDIVCVPFHEGSPTTAASSTAMSTTSGPASATTVTAASSRCAVDYHVSGHVSARLCNAQMGIGWSSQVVVTYACTTDGARVLAESGSVLLPSLSLDTTAGAMQKHPITVQTSLTHHPAVDNVRPPTTAIHLVIEPVVIHISPEHTTILMDSIAAAVPFISGLANIPAEMSDGAASTSSANRPSSPQRSAHPRARRRLQAHEDPIITFVANCPHFQLFFLRDDQQIAGEVCIERGSAQLRALRDWSSVVLASSACVTARHHPEDCPGHSRTLLRAEPQCQVQLTTLAAGGTMQEIDVTLPPVEISIPAQLVTRALTYRYRPASRLPLRIQNETELSVFITPQGGDSGGGSGGGADGPHHQMHSQRVGPHATVCIATEGARTLHMHLHERNTPFNVDLLDSAAQLFALPQCKSTLRRLVVSVDRYDGTLRLASPVVIINHMTGVADMPLVLHYAIDMHPSSLVCAPGVEVAVPFAALAEPLRLAADDPPTGHGLPLDVLCGMTLAAEAASPGLHASSGDTRAIPVQFYVPFHTGHVRVSVDHVPTTEGAKYQRFAIHVRPPAVLRNATTFPLSMSCASLNMDSCVLAPDAAVSVLGRGAIVLEWVGLQLSPDRMVVAHNVMLDPSEASTLITLQHEGSNAITIRAVRESEEGGLTVLRFHCRAHIANAMPYPIELLAGARGSELLGGLTAEGLAAGARLPVGFDTQHEAFRVRSIRDGAMPCAAFKFDQHILGTVAESRCGDSTHVLSLYEDKGDVCVAPMWFLHNASPLRLRVEAAGHDATIIDPRQTTGVFSFQAKEASDPAVVLHFDGFESSPPLRLTSASSRTASNNLRILLHALPDADLPHGLTHSRTTGATSDGPAAAAVAVTCLSVTCDRSRPHHVIFSVSLSPHHFPFEIENRTPHRISVQQRGCDGLPAVVPPLSSIHTAWSTLHTTGRVLHFSIVLAGGGRAVEHAIDPDCLPAVAEGWTITKGLFAAARFSTSGTLVVTFACDRLLHSTFLLMPRSLTSVSLAVARLNVTLASAVGSTRRTLFSDLARSGDLGARPRGHLAQCLSLHDFDIAALTVDGAAATVVTSGNHSVVDATVGRVRLQDVTWGAPRTIIEGCRGAAGANGAPRLPWLRMVAHVSSEDALTNVKSATVALQKIQVNLHDAFLHTALAASTYIQDSISNQSTTEEDATPTTRARQQGVNERIHKTGDRRDHTEAPQRHFRLQTLRVSGFTISAIEIIVSMARRSDGLYDPLEALPPMARFFVGSVEKAPITLSAISISDLVLTGQPDESVWALLLQHSFIPVYRGSMIRQALSVLGSLECIGNPLMLTTAFSEGFRGLVHSKGSMTGVSQFASCTGFGLLHSASLVTRTGGILVGSLTLDPQWLSGDASSASAVAGLREGLVGVFRDPVAGIQEGGLRGLLRGIVKGATGAVTKPVSGALMSASSLAEVGAHALFITTPMALLPEDDSQTDTAETRNQTIARQQRQHDVATEAAPSASTETLTPARFATGTRGLEGRAIFDAVGAKNCALFLPWEAFSEQSTTAEFVLHGHCARDRRLFGVLASIRSKPSTSVNGPQQEAPSVAVADAALDRARHLKDSLGASAMLRFVTLDQFARCVTWEEARHALSEHDFKAKAAPMLTRNLEQLLKQMEWVQE